MQQSSSSPSPQSERPPPLGVQRTKLTEMDVHPAVVEEDPTSLSSVWDWDDLLNFTIDDHFPLSFDSENLAPSPVEMVPEVRSQDSGTDRVRKRDPRMICSNFLAGRVPCACPEIDEKLEEEEAGMPGKKRPRTVRAGQGTARCQVPGCEADIRELKGYHRRHRVCLRCANASAVLIDGENKRYCQQCGKFHVLSDFDEGKRSCRRKLERHNNRRRRKPVDSKASVDKEPQGAAQNEDIDCDVEAGRDGLRLSSQIEDLEIPIESEDGHVSAVHSDPILQNVNGDSVVSFVASGNTEMDRGKDDSKLSLSPSYCDNKTAYSSVCPTGRISFKLYDWNPAEFPRRLRHQIFQWLADMPVELEGYIRPGCTILTVFISMPKDMWAKLSANPGPYIGDFVLKPGRMLYGRGFMTVYLNNMIFHTRKDGTSMMKVDVKVQAPRLHYVHPACFEAGKPMEFVACGSNLLQPKFRFLISFAGKYLAYDYCVASSHVRTGGESLMCEHQLYKIHIPHTEPDLKGPAFVEVENESGLSNFIPILIGDKETCSEVKLIQQKFDASLFPEGSKSVAISGLSELCEVSALRQAAYSEFVLDIAWLLREPTLENLQEFMMSSQIKRFNCLLNFLIQNESAIILGRILGNLKIMMDKMGLNGAVSGINDAVSGINDADMRLLQKYVDDAQLILNNKLQKSESSSLLSEYNIIESYCCQSSSEGEKLSVVPIGEPIVDQKLETRTKGRWGMLLGSNTPHRTETLPLLNKEVVMNVNVSKEWPRKSCSPAFSPTAWGSRPTVFLIATVAVCFGICVAILHPQKLGEFAVTIRRSLFNKC
ncbi:hypothetical protein SLA2020_160510 [Shorea laevis]